MAATTDYATARFNMVEGQIRPNKVTDNVLVHAILDTPRERFVPGPLRSLAYVDEDIPVARGRYLMEPMVMARLLQEARIDGQDVVLDIGAATGYAAAVIGRLAGTVVALEADAALAEAAAKALQEQGVDNAVVMTGAHAEGYPKQAPYDVIFIEGAVAEVPQALLDQLAEGGRLVCVLAPAGGMGQAKLYQRIAGVVSGRVLFDAAVRPLPGFEAKPRFEF
ncbi:MAG TPA: protein-L-isoaspartate O-methyltransferase [Azospirillaceae bacterium]|nr:protein-L-isoaspartate O-methyltransferase [Azospirillaceae bacterium]